jgi:hypothetical protein
VCSCVDQPIGHIVSKWAPGAAKAREKPTMRILMIKRLILGKLVD